MFVCVIVFQLMVFLVKLLSVIDTVLLTLIFPRYKKDFAKAELLKGRRL